MKKGLCSVVFILVLLSSPVLAQVTFIRGDANQDSRVDLSDSIFLNNYLFKGGSAPLCFDAGDVNDDGEIDLSDGIFLNNYLFLGSDLPPPAPYPELGEDLTEDDLRCGSALQLAAPSRFGYTNYTIDQFTIVHQYFYGARAELRDRTDFSITWNQCGQSCNFFGCTIECGGCGSFRYRSQGGYPLHFNRENVIWADCGFQEDPLVEDLDRDGDSDKVYFVKIAEEPSDFGNTRATFNVTLSLYGDLCANRMLDPGEEEVDCGGLCGRCGRRPVLVVPGIAGSYPLRGELQIDPWLETYTPLLGALRQAGYIENETLFTFPYAWWLSNRENAQLLKEKIHAIKNQTGFGKVDIVAHSLGGLLVRYYVANESYQDDVDKLVMLGTPHQGAPVSYLIWERSLRDQGRVDALDNIENFKYNFYLRRLSKKLGFNSTRDFVNQTGLPSLRELFPIFSYLKNASDQSIFPYPNVSGRNFFLEGLHRNVSLDKLARAHVSLVIGNLTQNTPEFILIPGFSAELGGGDDTVPLKSMIPFDNISLQSEHRKLPLLARGIVLEKLDARAVLEPFEEIRKWMFLEVFSPVDILLVSPSGRRIGFLGGEELNEVGGFYSREDEFLVIPNPDSGIYRLEVAGTGEGNYGIALSFVDEESNQVHETRIENTTRAGEIDVYLINTTLSQSQAPSVTPLIIAPDLVITNFALQSSPPLRAGQNITLAFTIMNNGTANATGVFWKLDTGSPDFDPVNVRGLNISVNRSLTVFTRVRFAAPGNYSILVSADYQNRIEELNERNNERSRGIMVV